MSTRPTGIVRAGFRRSGATATGPATSTYWVATADASLPNAYALSGITGLVKSTAGVPSAAVGGTDYVVPTGVSGGQTIAGGTGASENLTLSSTGSPTKGQVRLGAGALCYWDEAAQRFVASDGSSPTITATQAVLSAVRTASGVKTMIALENKSNTAGSQAVFDIRVGGATAGDPSFQCVVSGITAWNVGVDNSDADKFKISNDGSGDVGASTVLTLMPTTLNVGIGTSTDLAPTKVHIQMDKTQASGVGIVYDGFKVAATTYTLTGTTTPTASQNLVAIYQPTYTDASALTNVIAATLYIQNGPAAGGSLSFSTGGPGGVTENYAIFVDDGTVRLDGDLVLGANGAQSILKGTAGALNITQGNINSDLVLTVTGGGTGRVQWGSSRTWTANGAVATTLGSLGPTGANTTVQEWLTFKNTAGTVRYIPAW